MTVAAGISNNLARDIQATPGRLHRSLYCQSMVLYTSAYQEVTNKVRRLCVLARALDPAVLVLLAAFDTLDREGTEAQRVGDSYQLAAQHSWKALLQKLWKR